MKSQTKEDKEILSLLIQAEYHMLMNGFSSRAVFFESMQDAAKGMIEHGSRFFHLLGNALTEASQFEALKIYKAYNEEWKHYRELHINGKNNDLRRE